MSFTWRSIYFSLCLVTRFPNALEVRSALRLRGLGAIRPTGSRRNNDAGAIFGPFMPTSRSGPLRIHLSRAGWAAAGAPPTHHKQRATLPETRKTLLAQLAPMFGPQTENLAVEALGHILSGSEAARRALTELLQAGGAGIGQVTQVRTQDVGEDGARPDLVGLDQEGEGRVLIEAKFWAGLTENQPGGYLKRLESAPQPTALLFVAPAQRLDSLWAELCRLSESASDVASDSDADGLRSARIGVGPYLMLTSWRSLLGRMAAMVSAAADSHAEIDIRQLQGLAEQQDREAFLPVRHEELGPQLPRRVVNFARIVDDAVGLAKETEWVSTKGARMTATATSYGAWITLPRAEGAFGKTSLFFGVEYESWVRYRDTPLWLNFWDPPPGVRLKLEPLRHRSPPELVEIGNQLRIPIEFPVGKERSAVLGAVVTRLLAIARLITPEP